MFSAVSKNPDEFLHVGMSRAIMLCFFFFFIHSVPYQRRIMQTSHDSMRQFFAFFRVKRGHFKYIVIVGDEFSIF